MLSLALFSVYHNVHCILNTAEQLSCVMVVSCIEFAPLRHEMGSHLPHPLPQMISLVAS